VITSSEPLNPVVWEQIKHLDGQTLTVDNTVYRLHRIPELGLAIATWSSTLPLQEKFRHQLVLWLPLGLFISLLTSFLLLRLLRTCARRAMGCWMRCTPTRFRSITSPSSR
jgi:sensor c-di-GMP phosphodiesterase-like protein